MVWEGPRSNPGPYPDLWFGPFAQQCVEPSKDLAHDGVGDRADACAIPCLPIEALHLIRQDYARHGQAIWQCDLKGIAPTDNGVAYTVGLAEHPSC